MRITTFALLVIHYLPTLGRLRSEGDTDVLFYFDAVELPETLEVGFPALAESVLLYRLECAKCRRLNILAACVFLNRRAVLLACRSELFDTLGGETEFFVESLKRSGAFFPVGEFPRSLIRLGFSHEIQTAKRFPETGVVHLPFHLQSDPQLARIRCGNPQRKLDDEGGGF